MDLCAYGKILDVELSAGRISKRDIDPELARKYIGGMGLSCRILYDEAGIDVDPLGPDNIVIFANGPLTGTSAPCSGRNEITTKSPLTGAIASGNTGGVWGTFLKRAGYDLIVVRQRAERPVYLWINDDTVEIRDAGHIWGKDTRSTTDTLLQELGFPPSQVSVLTIGPAGECMVRYACPVNDYYHVAARGGMGAVMGSKRLKAIAVRGTGTMKMARPEEFREVAREARERLIAADKAMMPSGTLPDPMELYVARSYMPTRNFQGGVLPKLRETAHRDISRQYLTGKVSTCHACPVSCFNLAEVKTGKYAGLKVNRATAPGVIMDVGAKCGIYSLQAIWKFKELCHDFGLDYVSASGCIAFAMELFQRGIITSKDTDGIELRWGDEDAALRMLQKIAFRDGFGDTLAEGSVKAAAKLERGATQYVMAVKGVEMMMIDPRTGPRGWCFGDLTNPRGGDNIKSTHMRTRGYSPNWWVDKIDMFDEVKAKVYGMPLEEFTETWAEKPLMCRWFEDLYSSINALGLCMFTGGPLLALGPTYLSRLFSASTGWDLSPRDIMKSGERIFNLLKAYNIRAGLTKKDDTWPDRFFTEPLADGPKKGAVLSRGRITQLLGEYYELRGWDRASGLPTADKLAELGLDDIADDLAKLGKLPGKKAKQ